VQILTVKLILIHSELKPWFKLRMYQNVSKCFITQKHFAQLGLKDFYDGGKGAENAMGDGIICSLTKSLDTYTLSPNLYI